MSQGNGYYSDIKKIKEDVSDIKGDLASSIDRLTEAVNGLTTKFDTWIYVAEHSIPIKAVFWMFGILAISFLGKESVETLIKAYIQK